MISTASSSPLFLVGKRPDSIAFSASTTASWRAESTLYFYERGCAKERRRHEGNRTK